MKQLLKTIKYFIIGLMFSLCINISIAQTDVTETIMDNTHIPAAQMEQNRANENDSDDFIIPYIPEEGIQYNINQNNTEENENNNLYTTGFLIIFCIIILIYFFPTIVAIIRSHNNILSILILNLFLGWTFIGWVIALVWSCYNSSKSE